MSFSPNTVLMGRTPPLEVSNISTAAKCARPVANEVGAPLFDHGTLTLHQFMVYVSAASLVLTIISSILLIWRHLHRYTAPQEQRQIIRIAALPAFYCIFNFLALNWYQYYLYIQPIAGIYEAFAVAALFFLILEYVCPDGTDREEFFNKLEARNRSNEPIPGGSLKWFQRTWTSCLQYPLTKTVFVIIEIVTQYYSVYCENSFSPKHAHLYLQVLDWVFVGGALGACIRFVRRFGRSYFDPTHKIRPKVLSFIGIVLFQILQDLVFHLMNGKLFHPSAKATYNDLNFGVPSFMTCVEAIIFSVIFHWSFGATEFKESTRMNRYGTGPAERKSTLRAIGDALNLADVVAGTVLAFQLLIMRVQSRYGASSGSGQWDKAAALEPLQSRGNGAEPGRPYSDHSPPPPPAMPSAARDPSPPQRTRTWRADHLRPDYAPADPPHPGLLAPLSHSPSPDPSPHYDGEQRDPRSLV